MDQDGQHDLEHLVRTELAGAAAALTPSTPPVGRLVGRGRVARRRRRTGVVAAVVAVVALAGTGVRMAGGLPHLLGDRDDRPVRPAPDSTLEVVPGPETFSTWVAGLPVASGADADAGVARWDGAAHRVWWDGRSYPLPGPDAAGWDDVGVGRQTSRGLMVRRGSSGRGIAQLGWLDRSGRWTWLQAIATVSMPVLSPDATRYAAVEFDRPPQTRGDVGRLVVRDAADDHELWSRPVPTGVQLILWNSAGIVAQRRDVGELGVSTGASASGGAGDGPGVLLYDPDGTATPLPASPDHLLADVDARTGPWTTDRLLWAARGTPCQFVAPLTEPGRHRVDLCPASEGAALAPDGRHAVFALDLFDLGTGATTRLDARAPAAQLLPMMRARWLDGDTVLVGPEPDRSAAEPATPVVVRCRVSVHRCEVAAGW